MQSDPQTCPECGAPIPPDAPRGLCPKCLLAGAAMTTESGPTNPGRPRPPAPTLAEIAAAFPQLEILDLIGRGGMGFVYRARQPKLERDVAIKVLPRGFANDPRFAERFVREARLLARLNHPNIVAIYDFGEADGFFYLIMELVDGVNLRQAMRASRFTPSQALAIVPAICEALQFAHDEGVLHRDIKPENILLDAKGRVKIADFGIAKLMTDDTATPPPSEGGAASRGKTQQPAFGALTENQALGTPQYMAPEQIARPAEVDHRADIYSLGVVFYELLTGELPVGEFARPSSRTPLDERVDKIVLRALEKEREFRQQSAREFKTQVETAAQTNPATRGSVIETATAQEAVFEEGARGWRNWSTAFALGTAVYFTGLTLGVPLLEMFNLAGYGAVFLALALLPAVTIFLTNGLGFGHSQRTASQLRRANASIRTFAVVGTIMCLPVCGFGLFFWFSFYDELLSPRGGWHPALAEAVLVPLSLAGMFLLPLSCLRLARLARQTPRESRRTKPGAPPFLEVLSLGVVLVFLFWVVVNLDNGFLLGSLPSSFWLSAFLTMGASTGALIAVLVFAWKNVELFKGMLGQDRDWLAICGILLAAWGTVGLSRDLASLIPTIPGMIVIGIQSLSLVTGAALITRDNRWRRLTLAALALLVWSNLTGVGWLLYAVFKYGAQFESSALIPGVVLAAQAACTVFLPLWLLTHPAVRARFGVQSAGRAAWLWGRPRRALAILLMILLFQSALYSIGPKGPVHVQTSTGVQANPPSAVQSPELATLAPVVVETFPMSGARDVAPGRTELRVRFSKEMMDESWSWSTAWEGSTPESAGQPTYDESHRTCSLTVDLEPGRTYAYWLNSQKFSGFQDTQGQPAVPYLLIFQTRDVQLTTDH